MIKSQFIPDGIVADIFSRLPCKSVLRFKSGCKSWCCFISDPSFITLHFNRSSQNLKLFFNQRSRRRFQVFDLERSSFTSVRPSSIQFPMESQDYYSLTLLGSSCGLVCVARSLTSLYLWNPFTREVRKIPRMQHAPSAWTFTFAHGFGYDPVSNDLKLVVSKRFSMTTCDVFSMKSNSWKSIKSPTKLYHPLYALVDPRATVANGVFHWLIKTRSHEIIGFDSKNNKFVDVAIPQGKCIGKACLLEHKGHLCMSFSRTCVVEIWMLKNHSWIHFLRFDSSHRCRLDDPYRPICICRRSSQVILHNRERIVRSTVGVKQLEAIRTGSSYINETITCFETLISPNHFFLK